MLPAFTHSLPRDHTSSNTYNHSHQPKQVYPLLLWINLLVIANLFQFSMAGLGERQIVYFLAKK